MEEMLSRYQGSRWFGQTGSSQNIHEFGLRSGGNDASSPASANLQPKLHNFDRANENAAVCSVTHKSSGRKGSVRALRSSEN